MVGERGQQEGSHHTQTILPLTSNITFLTNRNPSKNDLILAPYVPVLIRDACKPGEGYGRVEMNSSTLPNELNNIFWNASTGTTVKLNSVQYLGQVQCGQFK